MKYFKTTYLSMFAISAALFLSPPTSLAQNRCGAVFESSQDSFQIVPYGQLRPDFKHTTKMTKEVPLQSDIKNQCSLGTCHLHSWVSSLEHDFREHHQGAQITLSMHYLTVNHWLQRSLDTLDQTNNNYQVELGADALTSRDFIRIAGLMPDSVWTGPRSFQEKDLAPRLQTYVNNIIANTKWARDHEHNREKKQEIIDEGKSKIVNMFMQMIGPIPQKFEFNGKTYSPHTFARTFFPQLLKPVITLLPNHHPRGKTHLVESSRGNLMIQATPEKFEMTLRELIDHDQNVFLGYDHQPGYVDDSTGIMSLSAFVEPDGATPLSIKQAELFKHEPNSHAVQVVGYELDPITNKVIKWKIKGSWGEEHGDHGYYYMYADYFNAFAQSISFYSEDEGSFPAIETQETEQLDLFR